MDIERFQVIEKQLAEQVEANHITNGNLANLIWMMSTRESKTSPNTTGPDSYSTTDNHHLKGLTTLAN
jgi:hypothetical protein